jgi:hypothetical protein
MNRRLSIFAGVLLTGIVLAAAGTLSNVPFAMWATRGEADTHFSVTFVTGTPPTNVVLDASYAGPAGTEAAAEYDAGDGVWTAYSSRTIPLVGTYIKFRGDWRAATGTYAYMFKGSFAGAAYTCEFSGTLDYAATASAAYREIFMGCTKVTAIRDNPFQPIIGSPVENMFRSACYNMSGVTGSLPDGFLDTSGLTGSPADTMFYHACYNMSGVTGSLPSGFLNTSGLTGSPAAYMFYSACNGMSGVTGSLPSGFLDTSGLTGSPAASMFYGACFNMSGVTGSLPSGFLNTSGLTGSPTDYMFYAACYNMSGVTGSLPSGFLNTSGLTGSPATSMFRRACTGMSGVTGSLPSGFLNTSGLTGSPAASMFYEACYNMSDITSGDFNISSNVTLTDANIVGPLTAAWRGMSDWTGQVYWGTNVIHTVLTPDSDIDTFLDSVNMPDYATIDANWK